MDLVEVLYIDGAWKLLPNIVQEPAEDEDIVLQIYTTHARQVVVKRDEVAAVDEKSEVNPSVVPDSVDSSTVVIRH